MDRVCVGRGESASGVGVSASAGCACRPAPSAVSAAEGLCRTAALESAKGLLCRTAGRLAHGFHKDGKKIPALT